MTGSYRPHRARWPGAAGAAVPEPGELDFEPGDEPPPTVVPFGSGTYQSPRRRGGPPPGDGLTREQIVAKTAELLVEHGDMPTQEAVADALGRSAKWVRKRGGDWVAITREARSRSG